MQNRSEILTNLKHSVAKGLTVHLKLRHQHNEVVTVAEQIVNDEIIIVKPVSLSGVSLPRTSFYLQEIEMVKVATIFFNAPLHARIRDIRDHIKNLHGKLLSVPRIQAEA